MTPPGLVLPHVQDLLGRGDGVSRLQGKRLLELEMVLDLLRLSPQAESSAHEPSEWFR